MNKILLISLLSTCPLAALAEETKKVNTEVELGWISTSGNTETNSLKAKFDLKQDLESFRNHFIASGLYKKDQIEVEENGETVEKSQTTAEKYFLSGQTDFKLNKEHRGLFLYASYEDDEFSGFEYQANISAGYSDRLFNYDRSHLNYSVGPGISFRKTEEIQDSNGNITIPSDETETPVLRLAMDFLYEISENAKFTQTVSSEVAVEQGENTKTKAETALSANITTGFALKASFTVDHNTHVLDGKRHADTQTALTFVYNF